MLTIFSLEKVKEERQHVMFPDEVDTPVDVPARVRFARYLFSPFFHEPSVLKNLLFLNLCNICHILWGSFFVFFLSELDMFFISTVI